MKSLIAVPVVLVVMLWAGSAAADAKTAARPAGLESRAKEFVGYLVAGNTTAARKCFDARMTQALPPAVLKRTWKSVLIEAGAFQRIEGTRVQRIGRYDAVFVTCRFAKVRRDVKVVFDPTGKVAGLFVVPVVSVGTYKPPSYTRRIRFREQESGIGAGRWQLPATLSMPVGPGPFPAAVLVHGSGPHDRDESIGTAKPFRDLAGGLASQGVATLRYEKRTYYYTDALKTLAEQFTVREETIDDALAAVARLRETPRIDPKRIFVVGHSLGAMLAPRIAGRDEAIAGVVLLAAPVEPLADAIGRQVRYLAQLDGRVTPDEKRALATLQAQIDRAKDPRLSADTPATQLPLGVPAAYWLDLRGYNVLDAAAKLNRPMLILQGQRDYAVEAGAMKRWKAALAGRQDVRMRMYPKLNHLFIAGEGPSSPAEFEQGGNVSEDVVRDIASWINDRSDRGNLSRRP